MSDRLNQADTRKDAFRGSGGLQGCLPGQHLKLGTEYPDLGTLAPLTSAGASPGQAYTSTSQWDVCAFGCIARWTENTL